MAKFKVVNGIITGFTYETEQDAEVIIPKEYNGEPIFGIAVSAFAGESFIEKIIMSDNISFLDKGCFADCVGLTEICFSNSITHLPTDVCYHCWNLQKVILPNKLCEIGVQAFAYCNSLSIIYFPYTLKYIGDCAFLGCQCLQTKTAYYKGFNLTECNNLQCRDYIFRPNKWSKRIRKVELCKSGYHFCTNLFDVFCYYCGILDEEITVYECEIHKLCDKSIFSISSKGVTDKIKPIKHLTRQEIIDCLNQQYVEYYEKI